MNTVFKSLECYTRLIKYLENQKFTNLMDYTLDSPSGYDLVQFYAKLAKESIGLRFIVIGDEVSDGKYKIVFNPENEFSYVLYSKARYTLIDVVEAMMHCLINPFLKNNHLCLTHDTSSQNHLEQ